MLTIEDKKFIQSTISESIISAFQDFYENIFLPTAQQLDEHVEDSKRDRKAFMNQMKSIEINSKKLEVGINRSQANIAKLEENGDRLQELVYEVAVVIKNHEKRLQKLEATRH